MACSWNRLVLMRMRLVSYNVHTKNQVPYWSYRLEVIWYDSTHDVSENDERNKFMYMLSNYPVSHTSRTVRCQMNKTRAQQLAETGDRDRNRHGPKEGGGAVPFRGDLGPRLIQCGLGRGLIPYQAASSSIQLFGHNRHEPKTGGCAPFRESCEPI